MNDKPWTREQRERLDDAVIEAISRTPDEEFLAELEAQGVDTEAQAEEMRQAMLETVQRYRKQQRSSAASTSRTRLSWKQRPMNELRAILERTSQRLDRKQSFTFAHRSHSGAELTDEEVLFALQALEELGCELDLDPEP